MRTPIRLATFSVALALLSTLPAQVDAQSRVPSSRGAVRGSAPAVRGPAVARPVVRGPVSGPVGGRYGSHYRPGYNYYPYYSGYRSSFYLGVGYPATGIPPTGIHPGASTLASALDMATPTDMAMALATARAGGTRTTASPRTRTADIRTPNGYWLDDATSDVRIDADQIDRGGVRRRLPRRRRGRLRRRVPAAARAARRARARAVPERLSDGPRAALPERAIDQDVQARRWNGSALARRPSRHRRQSRAPERDRDPAPDSRSQRPYDRPVEPEQRIEIAPATRFGTLSLRIQPGDAEVWIDGERWTTTPGDSRITIKLSPGRHRVEIRKDGFERYSEEIGVRENTTFPLNVSLRKAQ